MRQYKPEAVEAAKEYYKDKFYSQWFEINESDYQSLLNLLNFGLTTKLQIRSINVKYDILDCYADFSIYFENVDKPIFFIDYEEYKILNWLYDNGYFNQED